MQRVGASSACSVCRLPLLCCMQHTHTHVEMQHAATCLNTPTPTPPRHQAYDQHLNMILGDVEETMTTVEIDDETYEEIVKVGLGVGGGGWVSVDTASCVEAAVQGSSLQVCLVLPAAAKPARRVKKTHLFSLPRADAKTGDPVPLCARRRSDPHLAAAAVVSGRRRGRFVYVFLPATICALSLSPTRCDARWWSHPPAAAAASLLNQPTATFSYLLRCPAFGLL